MTTIDGGLWPLLKAGLSWWDWQRIESGLTGLGIPDVNGCSKGHEVWIELKGTSGWKPYIRPEQIGWAERRARSGGKVFLFVRRQCDAGPRRIGADELWIYPATGPRAVAVGGLKSMTPLLLLQGGARNWDWRAVEEILLA